MQNIFSSTIAAIGKQLKQSVKILHNLMENLRLPKLKIISSSLRLYLLFTFVIEPVNSVNAGTFVVSTEDKKVLRVLDFVSKQKSNRL